jgi:hypothetical protein
VAWCGVIWDLGHVSPDNRDLGHVTPDNGDVGRADVHEVKVPYPIYHTEPGIYNFL